MVKVKVDELVVFKIYNKNNRVMKLTTANGKLVRGLSRGINCIKRDKVLVG